MFDVAQGNAGGHIALATSCDENFPPENIIDGTHDTFWMSTGLFPQEVIISFQSLMSMKQISISCSGVRELRIERSVQEKPVDFEEIASKEIEHSEGHGLQREEFNCSGTAMHLRFVIVSGHEHFVSLHRIHVDGAAVRH